MKLFILGLFSILIHISTFLFGKTDYLFLATITLFLINFLLLLFLDIKEKTLKWTSITFRIFKFVGYLSFITISVILDNLVHTTEIRQIVLLTLLYNEIGNILKNGMKLGIKVPNIITIYLQKLLDTMPRETITPESKEE